MRVKVLYFVLSLLIGFGGNAVADDSFAPPIPPKRPKVMSASPAYIEALKQRANAASQVKTNISIDDVAEMSAEDVLAAISPSSSDPIAMYEIPVPKAKPTHTQTLAAVVEPSDSSDEAHTNERVVSFSIKAGQTELDSNLKYFLENHALDILDHDKNVGIEVQAYSSVQDKTGHSDMRLSLARALEVRKFLLHHHVDASRIKLTPLGTDEVTKSTDRIDLLFY